MAVKFVKFISLVEERDEGEDDGITRITRPVWIRPVTVRSFRERTPGEGRTSGTRIEFFNSGAYIVTESEEDVLAALTAPENQE